MLGYFSDSARLERLQDTGLLLLRGGAGLLMLYAHGMPKLLGFSERRLTFSDPLGIGSTASLALATFAEVGCSVLVIAGLQTRLASIPLSITMMVAAFIRHAGDPLKTREPALLFLVIFLAVGLAGPGRFSVDHVFRRRR